MASPTVLYGKQLAVLKSSLIDLEARKGDRGEEGLTGLYAERLSERRLGEGDGGGEISPVKR